MATPGLTGEYSPPVGIPHIVGLESWMWIPPDQWQTHYARACVPGGCVFLDAIAETLRFEMGMEGVEAVLREPTRPALQPRAVVRLAAGPRPLWRPVTRWTATARQIDTHAIVGYHLVWYCTRDSGASCGSGDLGVREVVGPAVPVEVRQYQAVGTPN